MEGRRIEKKTTREERVQEEEDGEEREKNGNGDK